MALVNSLSLQLSEEWDIMYTVVLLNNNVTKWSQQVLFNALNAKIALYVACYHFVLMLPTFAITVQYCCIDRFDSVIAVHSLHTVAGGFSDQGQT